MRDSEHETLILGVEQVSIRHSVAREGPTDLAHRCVLRMALGRALPNILVDRQQELVEFATTPVIGDAALLFVALFVLRLLPQGITGRFFRRAI